MGSLFNTLCNLAVPFITSQIQVFLNHPVFWLRDPAKFPRTLYSKSVTNLLPHIRLDFIHSQKRHPQVSHSSSSSNLTTHRDVPLDSRYQPQCELAPFSLAVCIDFCISPLVRTFGVCIITAVVCIQHHDIHPIDYLTDNPESIHQVMRTMSDLGEYPSSLLFRFTSQCSHKARPMVSGRRRAVPIDTSCL